jgi:hypothetical protein
MPAEARRGRLIAVEAARGRDAERGAAKVRAALGSMRHDMRGGISHWDASGTFYELRLSRRNAVVLSARTLLLLYASDLAFRLRWEIRPALAEGHIAIAAPYIETAIAFGEAAGLSRKWIAELFRFAPKADICLHVKDTKEGTEWKRRPMDGFPEFAAAALRSGKTSRKDSPRCKHAVEALNRLKRGSRCDDLRQKSLGRLLTGLRDRRPAPKTSQDR